MRSQASGIQLVAVILVAFLFGLSSSGAQSKPYHNDTFRGRIAYSSDGNYNDPDDWAASPVTLAILAESGLKDRLVHFDYNSILSETNPDWESTHAKGVLGAAQTYGFAPSVFHNSRGDLDGALKSIAEAINISSEENPLFFIIAGPMEVPFLGIEKSDRAKRQFIYCISHSRWNDGFDRKSKFRHTKRSVIEAGVSWVQIRDQNRLLSLAPYGRPAKAEQFAAFHWMRNAHDPKVQFLWERMLISTRPDPSDAGMAYFLVSGDEECDPQKLRRLLQEHVRPPPNLHRRNVRLEAENFRHLENFRVEYHNDPKLSHRLEVALADNSTGGNIRTSFDELFVPSDGRCDVEIRYLISEKGPARYMFLVNGELKGTPWESTGKAAGWATHTIRDVKIRLGNEIKLGVSGASSSVDYLQINFQ